MGSPKSRSGCIIQVTSARACRNEIFYFMPLIETLPFVYSTLSPTNEIFPFESVTATITTDMLVIIMLRYVSRWFFSIFSPPDPENIPYRQIVECTNDGIWLLDREGKTLFANSRMSEFLGYSPEELMGRRPAEFMDPDMAKMVEEHIKSRKAGLMDTYEARYRRKDGTALWVSTSGAPTRSNKGEFLGALGVHKDITEKKRIEHLMEVQQANIQTASKMAALGEMAGGIAHEINNPLSAILTLSTRLEKSMLEGNPIEPEHLKKAVSHITKTCKRIAKIIEGLGTFSRDGTNDPFRPAQVKTIIEDTLSLCYEKFKSNGIALSISRVANDLEIECKSTQISQILLNLLNNAFDAVQGLPEKWVNLEVIDLPDHVELRVVDSGSGIPEEVKEKMFQPFYTTKEIGKGTGLGLSISLGIAEVHRGTLTLDETSKNTCFKIELPKKQN